MFGDQRLVEVYRQEVDADLERGARAVFNISVREKSCAHRSAVAPRPRAGRSSASIAACSSHLIEPLDHALDRLVKRYTLLHLRMRHLISAPPSEAPAALPLPQNRNVISHGWLNLSSSLRQTVGQLDATRRAKRMV